jgi:hypothetical protein
MIPECFIPNKTPKILKNDPNFKMSSRATERNLLDQFQATQKETRYALSDQ